MPRHRRRPSLGWPRALLVAVAIGTAPAAFAASAADFEAALALQQAAIAGSDAQREANQAAWLKLSKAEPADPVLRAYAGSATTLMAQTTILPWKKMSYAEEGLALIDKALAQLTAQHDGPAYRGVPASLETRLTAAYTFLALPSMFNRKDRGEQLLDALLRHTMLDRAPAAFRGSVWMLAADTAQRAGRSDDARQWWQRVVALQAPHAALAEARLKGD